MKSSQCNEHSLEGSTIQVDSSIEILENLKNKRQSSPRKTSKIYLSWDKAISNLTINHNMTT